LKRNISKKNLFIDVNHNFKLKDTILKKETLKKSGEFNILNIKENLNKIGWHDNTKDKLWRYNQNYFDDLNSYNSYEKKSYHKNIFYSWIDDNQNLNLVPWDPYPTSLRIVNIIKWISKNSILEKKLLTSLAFQSRFLFNNIEYHILGNHLFSNAKALIFAGIFFDTAESSKWLSKGIHLMQQELKEQILEDGGHFEKSPMYHAIFLEDCLDLLNIITNNKNKIIYYDVIDLINISKKMISWMVKMNHPDKKVSFFNDSVFEISSSETELINYAKCIKVLDDDHEYMNYRKKNEDISFNYLKSSGYVTASTKQSYFIADIGTVGPNYIPSHAHADTLSYEFSLFNNRVFVNTGTSTYENNFDRKYERGTKSHNTVEINERNSTDVWSSFRTGKRAFPIKIKVDNLPGEKIIDCTHNGYSNFFKSILHNRKWNLKNNSLCIEDRIFGNNCNSVGRHILHPSVKIISSINGIIQLEDLEKNLIFFKVIYGIPSFTKTYYSPEFNLKISTQAIDIKLINNFSKVEISW